MLKVSVYRYNPDQDAAPFMQEFEVDTGGKDLMVLDVLALIKEQDEGFSYRRSCREGVCGSDGMNINGKTAWRVLRRCLPWSRKASSLSVHCQVCRLSVTWSSI